MATIKVKNIVKYFKILCLMKNPDMKTGSRAKNISEGCVIAKIIPTKLNIKGAIGLNIHVVNEDLFLNRLCNSAFSLCICFISLSSV